MAGTAKRWCSEVWLGAAQEAAKDAMGAGKSAFGQAGSVSAGRTTANSLKGKSPNAREWAQFWQFRCTEMTLMALVCAPVLAP